MTKGNPTFLCIASFFKGEDFIRYAKKEGCKVLLVTAKKLEHEAWPRECIDEMFYVEAGQSGDWNMDEVIKGMAYVMQHQKIDRIIALDDFDVEKAAQLREHFRIPGMGQTTHRYFRDKLAMRMKAQDAGIAVPAFSPLFNNEEIHNYTQRVAAPWVVKPRSEASAAGITKVYNTEQLWDLLNHKIGEERHQYLIEQFRPGAVYHVDALTIGGKVEFSRVSQYLNTPMEVAHEGGIFRSHIVEYGSDDDKQLQELNRKVMRAFGMQYSASHTEFIKDNETGEFVFLETASRVGGAHLAEMVEYSSGINLWGEWARIEIAQVKEEAYTLPPVNYDYAGIIVSLARQQHPDFSNFQEEEIVWRLRKDYHIGMILKSNNRERILELLDAYVPRIFQEFHASAPVPDTPTA